MREYIFDSAFRRYFMLLLCSLCETKKPITGSIIFRINSRARHIHTHTYTHSAYMNIHVRYSQRSTQCDINTRTTDTIPYMYVHSYETLLKREQEYGKTVSHIAFVVLCTSQSSSFRCVGFFSHIIRFRTTTHNTPPILFVSVSTGVCVFLCLWVFVLEFEWHTFWINKLHKHP